MSNSRVVERMHVLADELESGEITLRQFADQLPGHLSALEAMSYAKIKEGQISAYRIRIVADYKDEGCDVRPQVQQILRWMRDWLQSVPK